MRALKRERCSRGAVLIEFVIVLPVLLLLTLATIDWGWYFVLRENVVHATREGARAGSVAPDTATARRDASLAVQDYLRNALGAARVQVPDVPVVVVDGGYSVISVQLNGYPSPAITGLGDWTLVPTTINARSDMRLEIQP